LTNLFAVLWLFYLKPGLINNPACKTKPLANKGHDKTKIPFKTSRHKWHTDNQQATKTEGQLAQAIGKSRSEKVEWKAVPTVSPPRLIKPQRALPDDHRTTIALRFSPIEL
jgi:hypothetical protein